MSRTLITKYQHVLLFMISGFDTLSKGHFKKISDPKEGSAYVRQKAGVTKNHQKDSQDLRKGGLVPFEVNEYGLNSGLFLQEFFGLLNPKRKNVFQLPSTGKFFAKRNLHKKKNTKECYYANQKVGKSYVGDFMPKVNRLKI